MRFYRLGLLGIGPGLVSGFRDTSPFFAFSSSQIFDSVSQLGHNPQIALSSSVSRVLESIPDECPSKSYILVHQPGASASDYQSLDSSPHLGQWTKVSDGAGKSSLTIPDVVGEINLDTLKQRLISKCHVHSTKLDVEDGVVGVQNRSPQLIEIEFPQLPAALSKRRAKIAEQDAFLNAVINYLDRDSLTVVYTTSPMSSSEQYVKEHHDEHLFQYEEKPFSQSMHTDLKRDLGEGKTLKRKANQSKTDSLGLFETYNYMNAGIFQGAIAAVILISILYVGISAVAGIEVSYGAFSKEMGPAAQKKQQNQQQQT